MSSAHVARAARKRPVARRVYFPPDGIVVVQVERLDQRPERQALDDERSEARRRTRSSRSGRETGKAAPAAASARRASVTMPRMPAHEMIRPLPTVGRSIGRGG